MSGSLHSALRPRAMCADLHYVVGCLQARAASGLASISNLTVIVKAPLPFFTSLESIPGRAVYVQALKSASFCP